MKWIKKISKMVKQMKIFPTMVDENMFIVKRKQENQYSHEGLPAENMYDLFTKKTIARFSNSGSTLEKDNYEPKRVYSELDPYGEENWDDNETPNWNIVGNNRIYKRFVIPVGELSREDAERQIQELMSEYHDEVVWDEESGRVSINGETNISFSKDYWIPSNNSAYRSKIERSRDIY
jgi:hypothetical protein